MKKKAVVLLGLYFGVSLIAMYSIKYTGSQVVIDNINKVTEITGEEGKPIFVDTEDETITAMKLSDFMESKYIEVSGNVVLTRKEEKQTISAETIKYMYKNEDFETSGSSLFDDRKSSIHLTGNRFFGNLKKRQYNVESGMYFKDYSNDKDVMEIWSNTGYYDDIAGVAKVKGRVFIKKADLTIEAEEARYNFKKKIVEIWGLTGVGYKVPSKLLGLNKDDKFDAPEDGLLKLSYNPTDEGSSSSIIRAKYLRYDFSQTDNEILRFGGLVHFQDPSESVEIWGEVLEYYKGKKYYHTNGRSKYYSDKIDLSLFGNFFEFYQDKGIVYAKGDTILKYMKKTLYAGVLIYSQLKEQAMFFSSPLLVDENNNHIYGSRVEYSIASNTLVMDGNIQGTFESESIPKPPESKKKEDNAGSIIKDIRDIEP